MDRKIAVVGLGGVGGFLGALIAGAYPDVTFVARGERLAYIRENGLTLRGDLTGEHHVFPKQVVTAEELGPQDIIFISVKNYSLEEVCEQIRPAVKDDTIIVPVMNGVDPAERVEKVLGKGIVIPSLIYIVAYSGEDYSITQMGEVLNLWIGTLRKEHKKHIKVVAEILEKSEVPFKVSDQIDVEIWKKYILNCAYNVSTAYYDGPIGLIRHSEERRREYRCLIDEALAVAQAKGVAVSKEDADWVFARLEILKDNESSSLQRDVHAGRPSEVETFSGYIVKEARRLHIPVPVSEKMYEKLNSSL